MILATLVFLLVIFAMLSNIKHLHNLKKIASLFMGIVVIFFLPFILIMYMYIIAFIIQITFILSTLILNNFLNEKLSIYFSILIDLIIVAYFLEHLGSFVIKILSKVTGEKKYSFQSGFSKIIKIFKPKLCIYFLATIFTIIATIENITQSNIINVTTWNEIKPYLFEATITFIAFDTFVTNINNNFFKESKKEFIMFIAEIILSFDHADIKSPDSKSNNPKSTV